MERVRVLKARQKKTNQRLKYLTFSLVALF